MKISKQSMPVGYHNGSTTDPKRRASDGRLKAPPVEERKVIAWDMEGMNLDGEGKPQAAVIWGCSETDPMVGKGLASFDMLSHIIDVASAHPYAIHVAYGFRYDQNMLVKCLPERIILQLWYGNTRRVRISHKGDLWKIGMFPGKMLKLSRTTSTGKKTSVTIYDYSTFFAKGFLPVAEEILKGKLSSSDRAIIDAGKRARSETTWADIQKVKRYWECEIQLIRRVFEQFRDTMCRAGFHLRDWYGPGAHASYIIATRKLLPHLAGAQTTSGRMPDGVHAATKHAFAGGRFESFRVGRIGGPVYEIDINSAYPAALTQIPSLSEGNWKHVENPDTIEHFGFYRITYEAPWKDPVRQPCPLHWRDGQGRVFFPPMAHGWYASPEARNMSYDPYAVIHEGWYWDGPEEYPWRFLHDMYATRQRLGKGNPLSLPFKLGPNSLYGKLAQVVGWNKEKRLPPKYHALPIAAWVTSHARSQLWPIMQAAAALDALVSVETDAIFTTASPAELVRKLTNGSTSDASMLIGTNLGEWSLETFDELVYLQSGMYYTRIRSEWSTKSRGLHKNELGYERVARYLDTLGANQRWGPLDVETKPRFLGVGAARMKIGGLKENHCVWETQKREIKVGGAGKRVHISNACRACAKEYSAGDAAHDLVVPCPGWDAMSAPRPLPWERPYPRLVQEIKDGEQRLADEISA